MTKLLNYAKKKGFYRSIEQLKVIFEDVRDCSIFEPYKVGATRNCGAILFTVMRRSLSEGINFEGPVGHCAVVIGQPYPNPQDLEMKGKMAF